MSELTLLGSGSKYNIPNEPDANLLEWFDWSSGDISINIVFDEFTSFCPKTGQPDTAVITIDYIPDKRCVETKSLKIYFMSYRNHKIFAEHLARKIYSDLFDKLTPKKLSVKVAFGVRGSTYLTVTAN